MSFGWPTGDITTAIAVTYNLIQVLDNDHGAAKNYREAIAFLGDLKRVLEPLQAFTAWSVYHRYGDEIKKQLEQIRRPVEEFLTAVLKYEPSLGDKARRGWKRCLKTTFPQLEWYFLIEKKVLSLRGKIESHLRILDTLMQRLILGIVWKAQQELPNALRSAFEETIQPAFMVAVRECLLQTSPSNPHTNREAVMAKLSEHHQLIYSTLEDIQRKLDRPDIIQQRMQHVGLGGNQNRDQKAVSGVSDFRDLPRVTYAESREKTLGQLEVASALETEENPTSKICSLILLYILQFLKGLFLALSRILEPSQALMSAPLAKYNITFLDAIGRPPRVLPYEYFRSFKILQAFIEQDFKDLPGSLWVARGRYLILSLRNNQSLNENNWNRIVSPGAKIAMSMLIRKRLESSSNPDEEQCPESYCSGTWSRPETRSWITCPVCLKEIFNSVLEDSELDEDTEIEDQENIRSTDPHSQQKMDAPLERDSSEIVYDPESKSEEEDISSFKRIAREVFVRESRLPRSTRRRRSSLCKILDYGFKIFQDQESFFRVGRVFATWWIDEDATANSSYSSLLSLNQKAYGRIRRFVVVQRGWGSSICSPITTYSGQATLKLELSDQRQHAIIYTGNKIPQPQSYRAEDGNACTGEPLQASDQS